MNIFGWPLNGNACPIYFQFECYAVRLHVGEDSETAHHDFLRLKKIRVVVYFLLVYAVGILSSKYLINGWWIPAIKEKPNQRIVSKEMVRNGKCLNDQFIVSEWNQSFLIVDFTYTIQCSLCIVQLYPRSRKYIIKWNLNVQWNK